MGQDLQLQLMFELRDLGFQLGELIYRQLLHVAIGGFRQAREVRAFLQTLLIMIIFLNDRNEARMFPAQLLKQRGVARCFRLA